jgi:flagellar biogenesis protein FliO
MNNKKEFVLKLIVACAMCLGFILALVWLVQKFVA